MGLSEEVAEKVLPLFQKSYVQGIGTTLSGNALAVAGLRANLEHVMTKSTYDRMLSSAERMTDGMEKIIRAADLPWRVDRFGSRVQPFFSLAVPRTIADIKAQTGGEMGSYFRAFYANRGIFTPGLALISAAVTADDVDFFNKVFGECVNELIG
jgi:glutamate-1-semialdehyde 2,1-aminomutase